MMITCGIQPTGVVTMALKCYITIVTCAFMICLICMPLSLGRWAYISSKSLFLMYMLCYCRFSMNSGDVVRMPLATDDPDD